MLSKKPLKNGTVKIMDKYKKQAILDALFSIAATLAIGLIVLPLIWR